MQMPSRQPTPEIGVDELERLIAADSVHVVDVREDWEYQRRRVPGAMSVPLSRLQAQVGTLPRDKPLAVICESGSRSLAATDFLLAQGFAGTVSVKGGTGLWAVTQRPLESD